eukprot:TRINITY_DN57156_c0_g1_i1.p1 TRINITY_DN57156_c0_g1~~TRINITY_DN57156_c0_g1_i1.p1  ORF type:complete len:201 (+),score=21.10 TRINITY_DN57156_c0_g1_i1:68-670(+)
MAPPLALPPKSRPPLDTPRWSHPVVPGFPRVPQSGFAPAHPKSTAVLPWPRSPGPASSSADALPHAPPPSGHPVGRPQEGCCAGCCYALHHWPRQMWISVALLTAALALGAGGAKIPSLLLLGLALACLLGGCYGVVVFSSYSRSRAWDAGRAPAPPRAVTYRGLVPADPEWDDSGDEMVPMGPQAPPGHFDPDESEGLA